MFRNYVITVSSDEEDIPEPKKRIKLNSVPSTSSAPSNKDANNDTTSDTDCYIVLSDEDVSAFEEVLPEASPESLLEAPPEVLHEAPIEVSPESPLEVLSESPLEISPDSPVEVLPESPVEVSPQSPLKELPEALPKAPTSVSLPKEPEEESSNTIIENGIDHDNVSISKLFKDFLSMCTETIKHSEHKKLVQEKIPTMQDMFDRYRQFTQDFKHFQQSLEFNVEAVTNTPKRALVYFSDVYQLLQAKLRDVTAAKEAVSGKGKAIRKLERTLAKLKRRIDKLDKSEVNFDDEENSAYLQVSRYKQRAAEVHAKLCHLRKVNPYSTRITHQRLRFNHSKHSEINNAINKKFKNNTVFPTYHEVKKIIQNCADAYPQLGMMGVDIIIEAKHCFEKMGNHIQSHRKQDLYSSHSDYLLDTWDDPAKDDPALQGKLLQSYQTKVEEENKIFQKYSAMQEKGVKCDDSEEASVADSESDNDENNGKGTNDVSSIECITID